MCQLLGVGASSYYASRQRPPSRHRARDLELKTQITQLFQQNRGLYGSPRLYRELQGQGIACSEKRVARLMKEMGLAARKAPRRAQTTDSKHEFPRAANHLDRKYQVEAIEDINQKWAGDITYIPTAQGWLYLAVVLDLKSRRVIGWSMADNMEQELVQNALNMASRHRLGGVLEEHQFASRTTLERKLGPKSHHKKDSQHPKKDSRNPKSHPPTAPRRGVSRASNPAGLPPLFEKPFMTLDLMFHSDQGSQYAGNAFQLQLREAGIQGSMSRKGNCWDNAPLESFFATLKKELVYRERYLDHDQARASLFEYIEVFYNQHRSHSALGFLSPANYELSLLN